MANAGILADLIPVLDGDALKFMSVQDGSVPYHCPKEGVGSSSLSEGAIFI
jgi:hypothetical protein